MKKNNAWKVGRSGMTLIEIVVVVLVLLSLISILFVDARAFKRGTERAGCIRNIRMVQSEVREYQAQNKLSSGDNVDWEEVSRLSFPEGEPICPSGGEYSFSLTIPTEGVFACECSHKDDLRHIPTGKN